MGELKRKIEFFVSHTVAKNVKMGPLYLTSTNSNLWYLQQSRVKEAVEALKPQLTNEEISMRAILTLEGLATMDINMPLPLTEEPQPQQQTVQT